ncbi:hypothetical protein [Rhizobium mayense]|uniref:Uncharacterized protein n=1 Tax=Rhizobium mayense TaxID=1312184 RepID=A0ABT7K2R5_9HYPH|nr:hypothetical protein [Rhizobium mayense]MDL2402894.1 hypothetical protein [Rhizobium mayense]
MEYDEYSKFEGRQYVRRAVLAVFVCAALAALGAWLVQPKTASAELYPPLPDSAASTVSL